VITWARGPRTLWRRTGTRVVLLNCQHEDPMVLDDVGAVIWELLGEPIAEVALVDRLTTVFEADRSAVVEHLEPFLSELAAAGAVTSC
jgi:hypothetical protein